MKKEIVLVLLLISTIGMLSISHADENEIYIWPDGSVFPSSAPIQRIDDVYTLTNNFSGTIYPWKTDIVLDGNGYTLQPNKDWPYATYGIVLYRYCKNTTVKNFRIDGFDFGINIVQTKNTTIVYNTITNTSCGFLLELTSNNTIVYNTITNTACGFLLEHSSNNTIMDNDVMEIEPKAVSAPSSPWISNPHVFNAGIGLETSSGNRIIRNRITNNIIANVSCGIEFSACCYENIVSENFVTATSHGILISDSSNNTISENILMSNDYCIWIKDFSNNTVISENTIMNNRYGIWVFNSAYNKIIGNTIMNNEYAFTILGCLNNSISNNTIMNNGNGIELEASSSNSITGNSVANNTYGIMLSRSSNNTIFGNNVTNNDRGILQSVSWYNNICGNEITDNDIGVELTSYANRNNVTDNNIVENSIGISIYASANNTIYHNNFINNTNQVYIRPEVPEYPSINIWDNGYPSGGNYWSDYGGNDEHRGPQQNKTGFDWIGDTPYAINSHYKDRHPLMQPYIPEMEDIRTICRELLERNDELQEYIDNVRDVTKTEIDAINNFITLELYNLHDRSKNLELRLNIAIITIIVSSATLTAIVVYFAKKKKG